MWTELRQGLMCVCPCVSFGVQNYSVHAVMYLYYYLMCLKAVPKWFPVWIITLAQILQVRAFSFHDNQSVEGIFPFLSCAIQSRHTHMNQPVCECVYLVIDEPSLRLGHDPS